MIRRPSPPMLNKVPDVVYPTEPSQPVISNEKDFPDTQKILKARYATWGENLRQWPWHRMADSGWPTQPVDTATLRGCPGKAALKIVGWPGLPALRGLRLSRSLLPQRPV